MSNFQNLDAWKVSMELVKMVYQLTKSYPKEEMYGLVSQTRRAAVSIPSNIAEGMGRQYKKDTVQFLFISRGSLYELQTLAEVAFSISVLSESDKELLGVKIQKKRSN
jgi:four helix bundle protein